MEQYLKEVDDLYFNRVWNITKEINENIRHYNDHQTRYRSIASQWLLGAFAAMGFVLISNPVIPFDKLWLIFAIAFVASMGVYQLWRMDIGVFQTLINVFFSIGKDMESVYGFIPAIKNKTFDMMMHHNTGQTLFYFYYIIIFIFTCICASICIYLLPLFQKTTWLITAIILVLVFLRLLYRNMRDISTGEVAKKGNK